SISLPNTQHAQEEAEVNAQTDDQQTNRPKNLKPALNLDAAEKAWECMEKLADYMASHCIVKADRLHASEFIHRIVVPMLKDWEHKIGSRSRFDEDFDPYADTLPSNESARPNHQPMETNTVSQSIDRLIRDAEIEAEYNTQ